MAKRKRKGRGVLQDIDGWLKKTKILSNVGNVLLPLAGGALGTFVSPGVGTAVGTALGASANQGLSSMGYGRRRRGCGGYVPQVGIYNTRPAGSLMVF